MVEDEEIEKIIKSGRELPKIAMDLIERANRNGGQGQYRGCTGTAADR